MARAHITDQINAVRRELSIRRLLLPNRVKMKKMTLKKCNHEIDCMAAVLDTLIAVRDATPHLTRSANTESLFDAVGLRQSDLF